MNHLVILLFLLPHVLVSDCETGLGSLVVAACSVTSLRPHFLFVMAVVYIQYEVTACRVHTVMQCSTHARSLAGEFKNISVCQLLASQSVCERESGI